MKTEKTLAEMTDGEAGMVVRVSTSAVLSRRLSAMGLGVGTRVTKTKALFLRGPVAVKAGSTRIALGRETADRITVCVERG
ncbi:MAG: FeoA family protein [Planctomycetota bacterium]|nr:FeoA family protein [Planctomycetota bacterium]